MTPNRTIGLFIALVALFAGRHLGGNASRDVLAADQPPPPPPQEQIEVLTRGPVHEAFAEPVPLQEEASLIIARQPPANIEEVPPADRPQGDHFVWVPGYWSWDTDRNDFIWVSACWRVGPPNTYWVPGYWAAATGGWEWVAGFWAPAGTQEIEYLPAPPAPIDIEPPGPSPAADNMWVPGCWFWQQDQYVRRPGYWLRQQTDWVWEPSHYRWTPRGYVFEAGHWDYSLERRGVLFAPAYVPASVYAREGFTYSPTIALDLGVLSVNLFTCPRYSHYYFGDYYDDAYVRAGIYPRFDADRLHTWYDPIYTYDRWHYGQADRQWEEHQRQEYDHRRSDVNLRPARTYGEMETGVAKMPEAQRRNVELARPLQIIVNNKTSSVKFEQINIDARQKIGKQATDTNKFREERVKWEATGATNPKAVRPPADVKPPVEPKGTVVPPVEHKVPVAPPVEPKGTVVPPAEHKVPVAPPVEPKGTVVPPAEHKVPVAPPVEPKGTVAPPVSARREVPLTKPERVKIPVPSPILGRPEATPGGKGPPARPADDPKPRAEPKDAPRTDAPATPKDKTPADRKDK